MVHLAWRGDDHGGELAPDILRMYNAGNLFEVSLSFLIVPSDP